MNKRRVVITGIGLITPLGLNVDENWSSLLAGKSGVQKITKFDVSNSPVKIAAQIDRNEANGGRIFVPENYIEPREVQKMSRFIQYGVAAAKEAVEDSGWMPKDEASLKRTGVILGSGIGGLETIENTAFQLKEMGRVSPFFIPSCLINLLSGHVSIKYGFRGPNHSVVTACATGAHAIGDAARLIKYNNADVMVAGSSEAATTPLGLAGFAAARALCSSYNEEPEKASRPWDKKRCGFVMGEGAGVLVLEEYEHARKRGAKIYAEVVGYGLAGDAYHITSSHPEGRGGYDAMANALEDGDINRNQIGYINGHGTSTTIGDASELHAIQSMFLEVNPGIKVSSTKSSIGHLLGAAGSVEAIYTALSLKHQIVPATINLEEPLDEAKIDLVPLIPKDHKFEYALSNSFGFGGTNTCLAFKRI
ncbi:MAG: beta-ketoacyl-[acyl-carrier-protein] synthase II [Alphaproteobacteria bacterium]|nr:beta-ketoacyl-[acyl-carrier-protein] synthase II [Alphaproteobacteria bacterium]